MILIEIQKKGQTTQRQIQNKDSLHDLDRDSAKKRADNRRYKRAGRPHGWQPQISQETNRADFFQENLRSTQTTDARVSDFLGKFWRERKTRDDQGLTVGGGWIIERVPELSWLEGRPQIMVTSTVGQLTAPLSTYPQLLPAKRASQAEVKSIGQETQMPFLWAKISKAHSLKCF